MPTPTPQTPDPKLVERARALLDDMRAQPAGAPTVVSEAWLLGALGETDAAFEVLDRAEEERLAHLHPTAVGRGAVSGRG